MALPAFTVGNVLPPFVGSWPTVPVGGFAPFNVTMNELCTDLAQTPARRSILVGLLQVRERLRALGCTIHHQWLDGSFTEAVEISEGRDPGDIDTLSFISPAPGTDLSALIAANLDVFDPKIAKATYKCDHYIVDLTKPILFETICYWNSLFSHRRNGLWKGYVRVVDEGPQTDVQLIQSMTAKGLLP
jgi:hypothetical protein